MMRLLTLLFAFTLAGCSAAPGTSGTPSGRDTSATVQAQRASITSTLVLPATVQPSPTVNVTAPASGWYTVDGQTIEFQFDSGHAGRLALPEGLAIERALIKPGRHVPQNFPIASARTTGFALVAPLSDAAIVRLYAVPQRATAQIKDGPGPFPCPLADRVPQPGLDALALTCLVPPDLTVFAGMPAVMAVVTASAEDVVVLPVEAVAGSSQHGRVWVVTGQGKRELRDVRLGITDGIQIEIRSGIGEGETVLMPAPNVSQP
jgi:hypothetical protein